MDRFWLLTWTTYGTWLPGDDRGFVSNIDIGDGKGQRINTPGAEPAAQRRGLQIDAKERMGGPAVTLSLPHAEALLTQFHETVRFRGWELHAVAIMRNHVHIVLGVPGDPEPETMLQSLKTYGSRRLNREFTRPQSGTWWTEGGSRRLLPSEEAVRTAVAYVRDQDFPLVVWIDSRWKRETERKRETGH